MGDRCGKEEKGRKRSELEFGFGSLGVCNFAPSLLVRDLESLSFLNGF